MSASVPPLVTTDWLAARLDDPAVRVADVRWYLPHLGKSGAGEYAAAHIPGAAFIDLDTALAAPVGAGPGRHPLPDPAVFESAMRAAGVSHTTHVVAYDDGGGTAARLWWLLRYFGHPRVSLLDGGLNRWRADRHSVDTGPAPSFTPGDFTARPQPDMVVDKSTVADLVRRDDTVVLDARARERYEGRVEPIDARPGHIPGALNAPFTENLAPDGRFLSADALRARYNALGAGDADTVVAYCGSGVTACHTIFALHLAGRPDTRLYEGSWSDWAADPSLPAATGTDP